MKINLDKYIKAEFDTLWALWEKKDNSWVVGFFCQGKESLLNDGLICYLPLQGKPEKIRERYLSPVCKTPQEAIDEAYKLYIKWIEFHKFFEEFLEEYGEALEKLGKI